jgi:hypothetical protein
MMRFFRFQVQIAKLMTVHIALANQDHAVLFSDSQGSTDRSEIHGWHKQFVGKNFAVGVAGHGWILARLFDHLQSQFSIDKDASTNEVSESIEQFVKTDVRVEMQGTVSVLLLGYDRAGDLGVSQFEPSTFHRFDRQTKFGSIGSGSEFVGIANARNDALGIGLPLGTIADLLISAVHYAEAANESLTVDDLLSAVLFANGKTYLLGEPEVAVTYAHAEVLKHWHQIGTYWRTLRAQVDVISGEILEATRLFSSIRSASLVAANLNAIALMNQSVGSNRIALESAITAYFDFYDRLIGR